MIAQYERDQEKEAKKSRPEKDKWKKPLNKEGKRISLDIGSKGVKPSSTKKAVKKPQSKRVVETPSTITEEKRNTGLERWLVSFKAKIHQRIINPRPSPVLEDDQEAKEIKLELLSVYVREKSTDDQLHQEEDLGLIFDGEKEPETVSVLLAVQKVAEDVVDHGPDADHEKI